MESLLPLQYPHQWYIGDSVADPAFLIGVELQAWQKYLSPELDSYQSRLWQMCSGWSIAPARM